MSEYFPTDVVFEILLRLPVKSLIRCATVCKSWQFLIATPSFVSSHLSNAKKDSFLLRCYDKRERREYYSLLRATDNGLLDAHSSSVLGFPFKSQIGYFRIVGSCCGLLCLSDDLFTNAWKPIIIWNPSVRNHVALPMPTIYPKQPHTSMLGFGVSGLDVKVVRLVYCRKTDDFGFNLPPQVEVFSIKTGSWRMARSFDFKLQILEFAWNQAFCKGIVHWLAYDMMDNSTTRCSILAFEVANESFIEVTLPSELASGPVTNLSVSLIAERVGVVKYQREVGNEWTDVWVKMEIWTKLYRIEMPIGIDKVIGFLKNDEAVLVLEQNPFLASYIPKIGQMKNINIYGSSRSFYIDSYTESLLLIRGMEGLNEVALENLKFNELL